MKLHLQCRTQEEIGEAVGMTQRGVGEVLEEIANLQRVLNPSELDPKLGGVSRPFVDSMRSQGATVAPSTVIGKDGKQYPATRKPKEEAHRGTARAIGYPMPRLTRSLSYDATPSTYAQRKGIVVRRHTPPGSYQSSQCNAVSGYAKERSLRVTHFHEITS